MKHIRTKLMIALAGIALTASLAIALVTGGKSAGDAAKIEASRDKITAGTLVAMGKPVREENLTQVNVDAGPGPREELRGQGVPAETGALDALHLSTQQTTQKILAAEFDRRDQTLQFVENKVVETRAAVAGIGATVQALQGDLRDQVEASLAKVDEAQNDLQQTIEEARNGHQEEWARLRAKLAAYFEVFAEAAAKADASAEAATGGAASVFSPALS
jgi:hypothetical protein